jgi:hypothetical protein
MGSVAEKKYVSCEVGAGYLYPRGWNSSVTAVIISNLAFRLLINDFSIIETRNQNFYEDEGDIRLRNLM